METQGYVSKIHRIGKAGCVQGLTPRDCLWNPPKRKGGSKIPFSKFSKMEPQVPHSFVTLPPDNPGYTTQPYRNPPFHAMCLCHLRKTLRKQGYSGPLHAARQRALPAGR